MINITSEPKERKRGRQEINGFEKIDLQTKTADKNDAIMQFNKSFSVLNSP